MLERLTRLYEAFNPQFHAQGSITRFDLSSIPGAREGMGIVKHWTQEALYTLHPRRLDFLTIVLMSAWILYTFSRSGASEHINQARLNARYARIPQLTYPDPDGRCVVGDVVNLFDSNQRTCISVGLKFLMYVCHWNPRRSVALSFAQTCTQGFALGGFVRLLRLLRRHY